MIARSKIYRSAKGIPSHLNGKSTQTLVKKLCFEDHQLARKIEKLHYVQ